MVLNHCETYSHFNICFCYCLHNRSIRWIVPVALGAGAALVLAPFAVAAVGFTSGGIATGSIAAGMMSSAAVANGGGVAAGGLVATCQAIGATGSIAAGGPAVTAGVATAGGGVGAVVKKLLGKNDNNGGKPNHGKPSNGKPNDGKPNDGKPNDGKPNDVKPSDGKYKNNDHLKNSNQSKNDENPVNDGHVAKIQAAIGTVSDTIDEKVNWLKNKIFQNDDKGNNPKKDNQLKNNENPINDGHVAKIQAAISMVGDAVDEKLNLFKNTISGKDSKADHLNNDDKHRTSNKLKKKLNLKILTNPKLVKVVRMVMSMMVMVAMVMVVINGAIVSVLNLLCSLLL